MMSDSTYKGHIKTSEERWSMRNQLAKKRGRQVFGYTQKKHREWCNIFNKGVNHTGVFPPDYNISNVVFDMFHAKGNIVKIMLNYIRDMLANSYSDIEAFSLVLNDLEDREDYEISPWMTSDGLSRIKGRHTKSFTQNIETIIKSLKGLLLHEAIEKFSEALLLLKLISAFLLLMLIDEFSIASLFLDDNTHDLSKVSSLKDIASQMIKEFKQKVELFYYYGYTIFCTGIVQGDKETFYMHAMRYYFPPVIEGMHDKHLVGPGVQTMEGFEYTSFQTKRALQNHSNSRLNVCKQNLHYNTVMFKVGKHDTKAELKKKKEEAEWYK